MLLRSRATRVRLHVPAPPGSSHLRPNAKGNSVRLPQRNAKQLKSPGQHVDLVRKALFVGSLLLETLCFRQELEAVLYDGAHLGRS